MFDWQEIWYSDVGAVGNPIQNLFRLPDPRRHGLRELSRRQPRRRLRLGRHDASTSSARPISYDDTWTLRGGYSFADQPIPNDQMTFNILAPAVMEDHFSVGFTKKQAERQRMEPVVHVRA